MKFTDREKFINRINQWIRDGSNLESFGSYSDGEWVVLRGSDGAREELYLFFSQKAYDEAIAFMEGE